MNKKMIMLCDKDDKIIKEFEGDWNIIKVSNAISFLKNHPACIPDWMTYEEVSQTSYVKWRYKRFNTIRQCWFRIKWRLIEKWLEESKNGK